MEYTKEERRHWLILQCRYYNGEEEAPEEFSSEQGSFWYYEQCWVSFNLEDPFYMKHLQEEIKAYDLTTAIWDRTPLTMKAVLVNRYLHWSGCYIPVEDELKNFDLNYYPKYVERETNRERRHKKRLTELMKKCRLYDGMYITKYLSDGQKAFAWRCEKEWANNLADSYSNRQMYFKEFMKVPYLNVRPWDYWKNLAHKYNIPATLLACIGIHYKDFSEKCKSEMHKDFESFIIDYSNMEQE